MQDDAGAGRAPPRAVPVVKEGLLASKSEKIWNSRIQVWMRSPGIMLAGYAVYLSARYAPVHGPPKALPLLAFILDGESTVFFDGEIFPFFVDGDGTVDTFDV